MQSVDMFLILAWIIAPFTSGIVLGQIKDFYEACKFHYNVSISLWPFIVTVLTWTYIITY
jgi:hypothetical protein